MPGPRSKEQIFESTMRGVATSPRPEASHKDSSRQKEEFRGMAVAHPSASILLISPRNKILLLHRVNTSSSFASAHVFPGGHIDPLDGPLPPLEDPRRHEDSDVYRLAAIRECFEESGLLLAKRINHTDALIELEEQQRDDGRKSIHSHEVSFLDWLKRTEAVPDTQGLIPFTRWLTPSDLPKRYSTQMYIYFLPLDSNVASESQSKQMHVPTPDGGIEHTAAEFLYPQEWIDMALRQEIVLFPPQFFLLSLIAPFLPPRPEMGMESDHPTLLDQRQRLKQWVETDGNPPWGEKCISPLPIQKEQDKFMIIGMAEPGPELAGTGRMGDEERVLKIELDKEIERGRQRPRPVEVCWKKDIFGEDGKTKI